MAATALLTGFNSFRFLLETSVDGDLKAHAAFCAALPVCPNVVRGDHVPPGDASMRCWYKSASPAGSHRSRQRAISRI